MKTKILYAPMLLLALSAACGKTSDSNLNAVKANELTAVSKEVKALANKFNSSVEAKKAVQDIAEVANAAGEGSLPAAAGNAPVVAVATASETPTPAPAIEATPFALATSLSVGNPVIDGLCNKSFASAEALLFNGDQEGFLKIGLKPAENETCIKQLTSYNSKILNDLRDLNRTFQFTIALYNAAGNPTGETATFLAHRDFAAQATNPSAIQVLYLYLDYYRNMEDLYDLPVALEDVRLVNEELALLTALPEEEITEEVVQRFNALQVKLPVVQATLTKTQSRLNKYISLMNATQFEYYVSILTQVLAQPLAPEAAPVANQPAQPSQPAS